MKPIIAVKFSKEGAMIGHMRALESAFLLNRQPGQIICLLKPEKYYVASYVTTSTADRSLEWIPTEPHLIPESVKAQILLV